jgi:hypothetical protein
MDETRDLTKNDKIEWSAKRNVSPKYVCFTMIHIRKMTHECECRPYNWLYKHWTTELKNLMHKENLEIQTQRCLWMKEIDLELILKLISLSGLRTVHFNVSDV